MKCLRSGSILGMLVCLLIVFPLAGLAEEYVEVVPLDPVQIGEHDTAELNLSLELKQGWHVNSNPASEPYLIPTTVKPVDSSTISLQSIDYPPGEKYQFEFANAPISVYKGNTELQMELAPADGVEAGTYQADLVLRYQPCDDTTCLPPRKKKVGFAVKITSDQEQTPSGTSEQFEWGIIVTGGSPDIAGLLRTRGLFVGGLVIFLLGVALNLTPCVYPMIPITVGYFGDRKGDNLVERLIHALVFLAGLVIIYTILGAFAGWTGTMLGIMLQQPVVLITLAAVLVILAGVMFGWYEVTLPEPVVEASEGLGRGLGSFGMGMTLGVIAAPCLAPATVALLVYVGQTESMVFGAGMFFLLSLGLGLPYVFLAVFSSSLSALPGSGRWLNWVKTLIGFLILAVAWYFLWSLMSPAWFAGGLVVLALIGATVLSIQHRPRATWLTIARGLVLFGLAIGFGGFAYYNLAIVESPINWNENGVIHQQQMNPDQPTMVYVRADWCPPCKQMEVTTFRDKTLARTLNQKVNAVKLDVSQNPRGRKQAWLRKHQVVGVPSLLFFTEKGKAVEDLRIDGYATAAQIQSRLDRLLNS